MPTTLWAVDPDRVEWAVKIRERFADSLCTYLRRLVAECEPSSEPVNRLVAECIADPLTSANWKVLADALGEHGSAAEIAARRVGKAMDEVNASWWIVNRFDLSAADLFPKLGKREIGAW